MPLEKNYAVLEIQKIFLDATNKLKGKAEAFKSSEDLYLHVAKEVYEPLEQIFRLVFEPTFNEVFTPKIEGGSEDLRKAYDEVKHANKEMGEYIEKLNIELEGLRQNFNRVSNNVGSGDKTIDLLKEIIIQGLRNE